MDYSILCSAWSYIDTLPKIYNFYGLNGILYAQPIADLMAAIIAGFMSIRLHKELNLLKINGMH